MSIKRLSGRLEGVLTSHLTSAGRSFSAREDSRAFGGMIEQSITSDWNGICAAMNVVEHPGAGKKSIYDAAFQSNRRPIDIVGVDVRTKDLDEKRYSDGGVCSVGNLLQFMVQRNGILLIAEVGHKVSKRGSEHRVIAYVRVAPLHCLPEASYRIENLGTGQIRLNQSICECYDGIEWNRSNHQFYEILCPLAIGHYKKVVQTSTGRVKAIEAFIAGNYDSISLK